MTLVGTYVGYRIHLLEENYDDHLLRAKTLNPLGSSQIPRQHLLTYQEMIRKKQGGQMIADIVEDEGNEHESIYLHYSIFERCLKIDIANAVFRDSRVNILARSASKLRAQQI